jgi:hypothetical protein
MHFHSSIDDLSRNLVGFHFFVPLKMLIDYHGGHGGLNARIKLCALRGSVGVSV